ncbi:hypothetical protein BpHYR1_048578 [Brachionus plicatilis]|uniref:Uncharacterized protein n=1 Tax=Brachionus plicatilis TaxID=10195 RepID=A0A3M7QXJ4_BRAPC|nr:hypothetical protein BpHYR1_048578 [Brachionus plicatilis]
MIKKSATQQQYNENVLPFAQYFDKLTSHIIDPYGINTMKYSEDHENEENIDKVGQKRRRIDIAHAINHWVVISNYNPSEPEFNRKFPTSFFPTHLIKLTKL